MAEINSIANGTYVIGQTSATNFVGGTGIKVDQPSEGTVRIANDETVLWEGTYSGTSAIPFTESYKNFEYLTINYKRSDNLAFTHTFATADQTISDIALFGPYCRGTTNAGGISMLCSQYALNDTSIQWLRGAEINVGQNASNASANKIIITKIRGINRISGSNA